LEVVLGLVPTMKPDAPLEMAGVEIELGGKDTTPAQRLSFPPVATTQGRVSG